MIAKKAHPTCGACKNLKNGRCKRKDKKRSGSDPACSSFSPKK